MPKGPLYLDTSALYKRVIRESESGVLEAFLVDFPERVSSALARVELVRALARQPTDSPAARGQAAALLAAMPLLALSDALLTSAASLAPPVLRSLDAIHLASALAIPDCTGMVTYDRRLAEAAAYHGLRTYSPGA